MNWTPDCEKMIWTENELAGNSSDFGGMKKRSIKYYKICENTSESVLLTILELCNITFSNLYLLLNFDIGAIFAKLNVSQAHFAVL